MQTGLLYKPVFFVVSFLGVWGISTSFTYAQDGSVSVTCAPEALNLNLYKKLIQHQVKSQIDTSLYLAPKIQVSLRLVKREQSEESLEFSEVLDGLTLEQTALSSALSGEMGYSRTCEYTYVVRVRVTATEEETGAKFTSVTDSKITISSPGENKGKSIIPPVPGITPTATPTPTSEEEEEEVEEEE